MSHHAISRPHTRIRQARSKAKLTQSALAESLKLNRSAVSQWESPAGSLPTVENLIRIAHVTHVSFEWLATGRGRMQHMHDERDTPAVQLDCYAHDWQEERLLKDYRGLPATARKALIDLLESIKRRK